MPSSPKQRRLRRAPIQRYFIYDCTFQYPLAAQNFTQNY